MIHSESTASNVVGTINHAVALTVIALLVLLGYLLVKHLKVDILTLGSKVIGKITGGANKAIFSRERKYHRDLEIGRINEKNKRVQIYRFLNDMIIDLGLKRRGATPYEFLVFVVIGSILGAYIIGKLVMGSILMIFIMMPIVFAAFMCILYTKGNREHDSRIDAVIEAENIVCNNIKDGVVVAVRNSIDLMPIKVRGEFRDFLDNIELKNLHIRTALLDLNNNLGSISTDFIKKCIEFEMEEEAGIVGMFKDIVETNNMKTEMRNEMKRKFEEINSRFIMGTFIIIMFLGGVMVVYPTIRIWYFTSTPGRIILALDCLIMLIMYVIITWLKAREL